MMFLICLYYVDSKIIRGAVTRLQLLWMLITSTRRRKFPINLSNLVSIFLKERGFLKLQISQQKIIITTIHLHLKAKNNRLMGKV